MLETSEVAKGVGSKELRTAEKLSYVEVTGRQIIQYMSMESQKRGC